MAKKVIIIGSGLGGLSCGVVLAKNGLDVTVLEQGAVPGGCLQCFSRGGVKFETGMHFVGSAAPGEPLDRIFGFLGVKPYIKLSSLDPSGYDVINLAGQSYRFASGRERFIETLSRDFPSSTGDLERYMDMVEEVASASAMQTLNFSSAEGVFDMEYQRKSVGEVLSDLVKDPALAAVLAGNLPLYAGIKDRTPFATHAFIHAFYNKSAYRFVGGSDTLARGLVKVIESYGGKVLVNHKVSNIVCDSSRAVGVLAGPAFSDEKEFFEADMVISDAHPVRTLEMLDSKLIRPAYRQRIKAMPQTVGAFTVYIMFRPEKVPYMAHNEYIYKGETPWGCEEYTPLSWPGGLIYMHMCHEDNPRFARSGVAISYMKYDDVRRWESMPLGRRGQEYESFKAARAAEVLELLVSQHPELKDNIEAWWTSTPLTYQSYTGAEQGGMYGVERRVGQGAGERIIHRTRVPNLLLTGQNINSHGIMGVMVGTFITCGEILGRSTVFEQLEREV